MLGLRTFTRASTADATTPEFRGDLSPAELLVVRGLSHGLTAKMIAEIHHKSEHTIQRQIVGARATLNAKNVAHLVAVALRRGLID